MKNRWLRQGRLKSHSEVYLLTCSNRGRKDKCNNRKMTKTQTWKDKGRDELQTPVNVSPHRRPQGHIKTRNRFAPTNWLKISNNRCLVLLGYGKNKHYHMHLKILASINTSEIQFNNASKVLEYACPETQKEESIDFKVFHLKAVTRDMHKTCL